MAVNLNTETLNHDLKKLIINACAVRDLQPEDIGDDDQLINGTGPLSLESIDAVEVAVAIKDTYGIQIKDISSAKAAFRSVNTLADYLKKNVQ